MNTKQKRNLYICIATICIIIILLIIFTVYYVQQNYKESLYTYTNQVIAKIVEKYPDQEEEIIKEIFLNDTSSENVNIDSNNSNNPNKDNMDNMDNSDNSQNT